MTDARFLSNNSVTSGVNHVKFETLLQNNGEHKISQRICPCGATLYQKLEIFASLGAAFPPRAPIGEKFYAVKRTHVPLGHAKFHVNRCNESPLGAKNLIFDR